MYNKVNYYIEEVCKLKTQEALDQITYLQELITQTRLRAADGYPYFLLWGALWILGYVGSIWLSHLVWPVIGPVGGILSIVIGFARKKGRPVPPLLKKLGWLMLILSLYAGFLFNRLLTITQNAQLLNSYWPFHIGLLYIAAGIFVGRQIILIGGWLILVAVTGIWVPTPFQAIWLAAGGGGGLILTGFLLRKHVIKDE